MHRTNAHSTVNFIVDDENRAQKADRDRASSPAHFHLHSSHRGSDGVSARIIGRLAIDGNGTSEEWNISLFDSDNVLGSARAPGINQAVGRRRCSKVLPTLENPILLPLSPSASTIFANKKPENLLKVYIIRLRMHGCVAA